MNIPKNKLNYHGKQDKKWNLIRGKLLEKMV